MECRLQCKPQFRLKYRLPHVLQNVQYPGLQYRVQYTLKYNAQHMQWNIPLCRIFYFGSSSHPEFRLLYVCFVFFGYSRGAFGTSEASW